MADQDQEDLIPNVPVEGEGPVISLERVFVQIGTADKPLVTRVHRFPEGVPLADVSIRVGKKKQLTKFEPIEVAVTVTRRCVDSNKGVALAQRKTTQQVLLILDDVMKQVIEWDRSGGTKEVTL